MQNNNNIEPDDGYAYKSGKCRKLSRGIEKYHGKLYVKRITDKRRNNECNKV